VLKTVRRVLDTLQRVPSPQKRILGLYKPSPPARTNGKSRVLSTSIGRGLLPVRPWYEWHSCLISHPFESPDYRKGRFCCVWSICC
jgi:hypothetical protein